MFLIEWANLSPDYRWAQNPRRVWYMKCEEMGGKQEMDAVQIEACEEKGLVQGEITKDNSSQSRGLSEDAR